MLPNDDLARWGEPPTTTDELALAESLGDDTPTTLFAEAASLREVSLWMRQLIHTILEQSDLLENLPPPAGELAGWLRLAVSRALPGGLFQSIASTHLMPMTLRDLRRVPDDPDRVTLRTGDHVRVEVICDRPGFLAVLNVGPGGNLRMLHPEPGRPAEPVRPGEARHLFDVELIPPAGRERLYAIWTRQSATVPQLADLVRPGAILRDMVRVQEALADLPETEWQAVLLELDHQR